MKALSSLSSMTLFLSCTRPLPVRNIHVLSHPQKLSHTSQHTHLFALMMMIADKPQSIPLTHTQKSSHERQQNLNLFNIPKAASSSLELTPSTSSAPRQQKSKSKSKSKSKPQQTQQQTQLTSKPTSQKSQNKNSNSKKSSGNSKIVIPPRSVEVSFNSNNSRGSQRAMLKSTADDLKQTTQDIKNLLITPSLPDGSKPNFRSSSSSSSDNSSNSGNSNNRKTSKKSPKSPNSQHAKLNIALNAPARLPDGSVPNFNNDRNHSAPLSRSASSNSSRSSKPNSASSNSSNSTDSLRYAGSSFHAEPKAVTLPKPSFLRK